MSYIMELALEGGVKGEINGGEGVLKDSVVSSKHL